ncbi:hypothetical protein L7F22_064556 [Adiantum nelumboides]|nr:hypothetical protein [Adiantum nelumboides]
MRVALKQEMKHNKGKPKESRPSTSTLSNTQSHKIVDQCGIGRHTAFLFAQEGASVVVADYKISLVARATDAVKEFGGKCLGICGDVSIPEDVEAMVSKAEKMFGALHIVFNNAGVLEKLDHDAVNTPTEVIDKTLAVNFKGTLYGCRYGIPAIKRAGGGSVINVSSTVSLVGSSTPKVEMFLRCTMYIVSWKLVLVLKLSESLVDNVCSNVSPETMALYLRGRTPQIRGLHMPVDASPDLVEQEYVDDTMIFCQHDSDTLDAHDFYKNGASLGSSPQTSIDQSLGEAYHVAKLLRELQDAHTMVKEEAYHTDYSPPQNHKNSPIHP